jgi:methyltransferase-like protein/ubiquinone/menaquinone biosynthesis C-methylase UbiE
MPDLAAAYDAIPYPTLPNTSTHPDRLATVARLMGLATKPPDRCRMLELGCGDGLNLVSLALLSPESEFVGFDLAASPIARGQATIAALGLGNVRLMVGSVEKPPSGLGLFDYVAAHGVYSWVPAPAREALLAACKAHLAPNGVAYVSYNTMPGGHIRRMLREMTFAHIQPLKEPAERVAEARAFAGFLARSGDENVADPYRALLLDQARRMARGSDAGIYHDELAAINDAFYVSEFLGHAGRHGLQFLGESDFFEMQTSPFSEEAAAALEEMAQRNVVMKEQYVDFLSCRQFRKTLLCHEGVELNRAYNPTTIAGFYVSSDAAPVEDPDGPAEDGSETFQSPGKGAITTPNPLARAVLHLLHEAFPTAIPFGALSTQALARSGEDLTPFKATQRVAQIVYASYAAGSMELSLRPPHVVREPAERPLASPLVRYQLREGPAAVVNLRHETTMVDERDRSLLLLLDGERDREALVAELLATGWLAADAPPDTLESALTTLATAGLLV